MSYQIFLQQFTARVIAEQQQAQFPAAIVPRKMHLDRCERLAAVSLLHTDVDVVLGRR